MKLIQAMKQTKDLARKAEDLKGKAAQHCAHMSFETPPYGSRQREQVREWLQAIEDINEEILKLRIAIQKTNLVTEVTIELDGKPVTKTIAAWIHRRRDLAKSDMDAWAKLTDRGLREGALPSSQGVQAQPVTIVRNFEPAERDRMIERYRSEPTIIDSTLETVNAVTDLID